MNWLKEYNPNIHQALLRTARIAADDLAFLDAEAEKIRGKVAKQQGGTVIIDKESFISLPTGLQRHLLRGWMEMLLGNIKDIEAVHIEEILNTLDKTSGKKKVLSIGISFVIERDRYLLGVNPDELSPYPVFSGETRLKVPGTTAITGWEITAVINKPSKVTDKKDEYSAHFDYDLTGEQLSVRKRRPGDRFQPLGMAQSKKLNEFMIDAGIPQSWRPHIPLVCNSHQIIWLVGQRIDDRVKVTDKTGMILNLSFVRR